ncbi:hypothetical protein JQ615_36345 [Bradyrhizobium jicamae]|uniref:DUF4083 domain-containing protein n=1 Tax=Bradyrhizobium jicamae TaxID=280332 RepID=A0ABS5FVM8_9BRAD|nr:hypothetical protein [Bradyrhizobium jicamae]MBR0800847.1 hypothetical protein [Bradyrhizobium jicamae]
MSSLSAVAAVIVLIVLIACVALFFRTIRRWDRLHGEEVIRRIEERLDRMDFNRRKDD